MAELFSNFARTTLSAALSASATSMSVATGGSFPTPTNGDFFRLVIASPAMGTETKWEVCRCTARSGNTLTIQRAQEGTAAQAWGVGDKVELRLTAGAIDALATAGADGADGYTVKLALPSHVFPAGTSNATATNTGVINVIAYKGATQVAASIGTITGQVTGLTTAISNNGTVNAGFTATAATTLATRNGQLTIPVTVDGKVFTLKWPWALALTGATGGVGATGDTGAIGPQGAIGPNGLTVWHTATNLSTTITTGTITNPTLNPTAATLGKDVTIGDLVFSSGNNHWGRVTARTSNTAFTVTTMGSIKGDTGATGAAGASSHLHIRWGTTANPTSLLTTPNEYIGIYSGTSATAPTTASSYTWYQWKGGIGATGTQGEKGDTGAAGLDGVGFWGWNTASNLTNISSISGMKVGDYVVNTGTASRTILGQTTDIGGVVKSTSATAGTAVGNIRGAAGAQGPQGPPGYVGTDEFVGAHWMEVNGQGTTWLLGILFITANGEWVEIPLPFEISNRPSPFEPE